MSYVLQSCGKKFIWWYVRYQTIVGKARRAERDQEGDEEPPFERGCPGAHYQRHAKTVPRINP
jgi:hypothetical protein